MRGWAHKRRGFIRGVTQVLKTSWAYLREGGGGGGSVIGGEIRYVSKSSRVRRNLSFSFI